MADAETVIAFPMNAVQARDVEPPQGSGSVPVEPPVVPPPKVIGPPKEKPLLKTFGGDTLNFFGALVLTSMIVGAMWTFGKSTNNKSVQAATWYLVILLLVGFAFVWSDKLLASSK